MGNLTVEQVSEPSGRDSEDETDEEPGERECEREREKEDSEEEQSEPEASTNPPEEDTFTFDCTFILFTPHTIFANENQIKII